MSKQPDIAQIATLIGDSARSKMLIALMRGKALTATELATEAEITAQTASSHLAKLAESQLLNKGDISIFSWRAGRLRNCWKLCLTSPPELSTAG